MDGIAIVTAAICLAGAFALVIAERRSWALSRAMLKPAASMAFVVLAMQNGAAATYYGRLLLVALALSWIGDAFLLSKRNTFFLAGIGAFLFAHVTFATAFTMLPIDPGAFAVSLISASALGATVLFWLWERLSGFFKFAVPAYVAALAVMTALAVAVGATSGSMLIPAGAMAFAVSDISVARDRFVSRNLLNRTWGLPLYYLAQVMLAASAAS